MKKIYPINVTSERLSFAIRARYDAANLDALTSGGGYYPCTGVIEIEYKDEDAKERSLQLRLHGLHEKSSR